MKVIAYTALLYGSEYLGWAIRSIIDYVDEYYIIYDASGHGSHGHRSEQPCPDSRELLMSIASKAAGDKLRWIDGEWPHEGAQRDTIHKLVPDADVILVLDADEIWQPGLAKAMVDYARGIDWSEAHRSYRIPIIHYWRSFYRCVLHDPAFPERMILPRVDVDHGATTSSVPFVINHMGYAQRLVTVGYKQYVHGHKNEWRHDIDWFRERYVANAQHDCHPVAVDYWNPAPVDPLDYMPGWMVNHPYFFMEVIK